MVPPDDSPGGAPTWPPPHPSPPLPPPREYGAPGTPLAWQPWLYGALAVLVVAALVTVGLVVLLPGGGDDDGEHARSQPTTSASASETSESAPPAPPAPFRCWDGSDAQKLKDCSMPAGAPGLAWVFPAMANQKCGASSDSGPGVVQRVLCVDRLTNGNRIRIGYYEWESVDDGLQFYVDQDLARSDAGGLHLFGGAGGDVLKSAALYMDAPFSFTITVSPDAPPAGQEDLAALAPRPAAQLRGVPVG